MYELYKQARSYVWIVLHRRWIVLACMIAICVVGWIGVAAWPNTYEVNAKVYLDTHSVLKRLLKGLAVENTVRTEFAQVMRRTLLSRPNLEAVIRDADMDHLAQTPEAAERQILSLGRSVTVSSADVSNSNIYQISYSHSDPELAKRVVESLLNLFVEKVLGVTRVDTDVAQMFLDEQIKSYRVRLEASEERLKDFKIKNISLMPSESSSHFHQLERFKARAADAKLELDEAERRRTELKKQVATVKANVRRVAALGPGGEISALNIDDRIAVLENELNAQLLNYTQQHPDVLKARRALENLYAERKENPPDPDDSSSNSIDGVDASPELYQNLQVILTETDAEIGALKVRVREYETRIKETLNLVQKFPQIEAELARLGRDYKVSKQTYHELVERREVARISRRADQSVDSVQFQIIEPPVVPVLPIAPNRPLLFSLVLVVGIAGGIGLAIVLEQLRPAFYTPQELRKVLGVPVLGSVTMIWTEQEKKARRNGVMVYGALVSSVLVLYGGLIFVYTQDYQVIGKLKSLLGQVL